jgi:hypothetical protein
VLLHADESVLLVKQRRFFHHLKANSRNEEISKLRICTVESLHLILNDNITGVNYNVNKILKNIESIYETEFRLPSKRDLLKEKLSEVN